MSIENSLWCERYRPKSLSEYIFSDPQQKLQIDQWVKDQQIPHILCHGSPGTGKSSLALALMPEIDIHPYDVLFINASRENNVDIMRNKITSFISTIPFGKLRVVILDEADALSFSSQQILRGIMEQFSASSRFILTCNYPNRILPAIHSRTQSLEINKLDINDFTAKMAEILVTEEIDFDLDVLDNYVKGTWPDLRKCINVCQQNSIDGKLIQQSQSIDSSKDYKIAAIELLKNGNLKEARKIICSQVRPEELEELFRFFYDNLEYWGSTDEQKDQAILIIRKGMIQIPMCADAEILACAVMIELSQIQ